ncbi:DNA polymerase III subunit gamma/tau [Lysinibacillus sp. UGB7]|uniref:DNA polymerase III subunit gamma/tau n=1 Tax=Lysinibacillus sp. UGB7 TaxID=3411039 RepID=UPI003B80EDD3
MNTVLKNESISQLEHKALYRKYRPDDFSSLVGQDHVRITLENAIAQGTVSHAYLFTGPRGTGKTSTAKLFAKALNCENPDGCNPCGKCHSCSNDSTDIIELDAASNNSVDDIRQLKENIILAPMNGKYKVYILDEVHMLTTQAFNAFLKTLEEPPSHARFVLATTEVHKLPPTILSRCQRFDFRRISTHEIVGRLKYVLIQEGRSVEDTALNLIAQVSAGGMRDALSLLDQALSRKTDFSEIVTLSEILELTGAVDVRVIGHLISLLANEQIEAALSHFNTCFESGKEPKFFIEEMMIYLRDILIFKKLGPEATLKKANTDENFQSVVNCVDEEKIYIYLEELQQTLSNSKFHHDIQLLMEMTIIRMVHGEKASLQAQIDELRLMITNANTVNYVNNISEQVSELNESVSTAELNSSDEKNTDNDFLPEQTKLQEAKESNNQNFVTSQVDITAFRNSEVNLPGFEPASTSAAQLDNNDRVVDINDPVEFIKMAVEANEKGLDWTEIPPEVDPSYPIGDPPPEEESDNTTWTMPPLNSETKESPPGSESKGSVIEEEEDIGNANNIILSKREKSVMEILQTATLEFREQFNKVRESIVNELGNLNISSKRVFSEFVAKAVNDNTVILVHENKIQVKLIEKVVHRKNISEAFENTYKEMEYIAITNDEWKTVVTAFKHLRDKK